LTVVAAENLKGQAAVVTGSSTGIGRAIALELANAGAHILVHARQNGDAAEEVALHARSLRRDTRVVLADLSDPLEQDRLVTAACDWRPIDIWINNAGTDVLTGEAADWSFEEKLEALWRVDVVASLRLSRAIGRRMYERGQGTILNMGWDQANTGMAGDSGIFFTAVKGAVMAATCSLAKSFAPHVRVNCIAPGWIRTEWGEHASPEWQARVQHESLLARWGETADVARVAHFLVSPAASFINGQVIPINGGWAG
jgi:3-oxoacyl-[acyl-carrier protein] reductase